MRASRLISRIVLVVAISKGAVSHLSLLSQANYGKSLCFTKRREITDNLRGLEAALEQFREIAADLGGSDVGQENEQR
jgi:hypothetical protein